MVFIGPPCPALHSAAIAASSLSQSLPRITSTARRRHRVIHAGHQLNPRGNRYATGKHLAGPLGSTRRPGSALRAARRCGRACLLEWLDLRGFILEAPCQHRSADKLSLRPSNNRIKTLHPYDPCVFAPDTRATISAARGNFFDFH